MSLFGNLGNNTQNQSFGSSLFGGNNNTNTNNATSQQQQQQQPQQSTSLFGQSQPAQQSTSLFGQSQPGQQSTPSLFGASAQHPQQQQQQQQQSGGMFGQSSNNAQPQQQSSGLFGQSTTNNQQSGGLFGQSTNNQQPQQQQQQQQQSNGMFGQSTSNNNQSQQQPQQSMFGSMQNNANSLSASLLSASTSALPPGLLNKPTAIGFTSQALAPPRDKTIPEQMEILMRKWSPDAPECMMQHYFYVAVPPEKAPFITMPPNADEREWERALRNKPSEGSVPVIAKGFQQLGTRLRMQVEAVRQLQLRLHEMNNSLGAMMQNHELVLSVRAAEAKRRHIGLSQRCLALAIRAQVLGNRGFALDGAEEELKRKLNALEKTVFDPAFSGREEEIWARMVAIRERSRWLQEESEKLGRQIAGENGVLDDAVLAKTKKILHDYDTQISHLKKELEDVKKEFLEWEAASRPSS